jgi:glycosyltransferase involved in cell wall biosynthesis
MKISLFVHDLASNPIVRVYPISQALAKLGYEVEVLGFIISGRKVYQPYRDFYEYKTIHISECLPCVLSHAPKLAARAGGEVIYAFKPLWTSYWPALLASGFGRHKPILLDVEDDELTYQYQNIVDLVYTHLLHGWRSARALKYKLALHPLTYLCKYKTVVSSNLQKRYGGHILLHGPDETTFDPDRPELDHRECRRMFDLPEQAPLVLFAGVPHRYKGLRMIVEALHTSRTAAYHLVLAGPLGSSGFKYAKENLLTRCHLLGMVPNHRMPELLSAVDVVPIPQHSNKTTEAQIPAKLLEAMAMSKPIIASRVSDLAEILGAEDTQPRGWIISPGSVDELANALEEILIKPKEARQRGQVARQFFEENASITAIATRLEVILKKALAQRASHG